MAVNRYLTPKYLDYQSQFVPQEIPWDILQANMEKKQNKRDNLSKDLANSLVQPTGMQYANDLWGNTQELDDYKNSLERSNEINARVDEVSKKLANTEVNKEIYSDLAEIQKLKNQAETENAVYAERKKVYDDYQKALQTGKINPGDHRAIQYQKEIDKMKSNSSYVPTIHGIQEAFDNNEFVKKAVGDIKVEASTNMSRDAGYFNKSENRRITRDKILNSLTGAFNSDSSLRDDITTEAQTYAYQHGIEDINTKVKLADGSEATIYDIVKQQRFDDMMQNAEKYIYSDTKQTMSSDTSYWKGLEREDKIVANLPSMSVVNQKIKGLDTFEAMGVLTDYKVAVQEASRELPIAQAKLLAMATNPNGIENSKDYLRLKSQIVQMETAQKNYQDLYNAALESKEFKADLSSMKQEAFDMVEKSQKPYWKEFLDKAKTPEEIQAALSHMSKAANIPRVGELYSQNINKYMTNILQSSDKPTESTLLHWGTGSKDNKIIFADIESQFKLADNIEAKDENGNLLDTRNVKLDMSSGYGIFTDASGNLNLKLKAKPGDAFHPAAKDVIVRLDDRTTFGKKLLQDAYNQANQMFEATGDSSYEALADEIETTLLNNTDNIITSFNDTNKMRTVQNKMDLMQPGSTWTYAQVSPDGSDKLFYTVTSLGNKQFDVKITDGRNDITDKMLGEHEPVSSPQEIYKLMQRQNGRR